tara:strand:- start:838 stop:1548 length:711 start_codon:yes stop_codon:yes gene_type:complete
MLMISCSNQNEESTRHFCDNEKALLFPYYQEPWDSTVNINWDLSLSMDELYKSAVAQTGKDTCVGKQVYFSSIELSKSEYLKVLTEISNGYCPCCNVDPPGQFLSPKVRIAVFNDSTIMVDWDTLKPVDFKSKLMSWVDQTYFSVYDRSIIFKLQWADEISGFVLKSCLMDMFEVYIALMKKKIEWLDEDLCSQQLDSNFYERRFPKFLIKAEKHIYPPMPDSLRTQFLKDIENLN